MSSVPDDEAIAARFAAGDEAAFREAYRRWAPLVFRLASRALRDRTDAEDITQNVFISAWRGRQTFDADRGDLAGWIVGITRHRIADAVDKKVRTSRRDSDLADIAAISEVRADLIDSAMIEDELQRLGPVPQQVVRLSYFDKLTHAEIAEELNLPLGTVKSHIRRSIQRIRVDWEVEDGPR